MSEAIIAAKAPAVQMLEANTYYWCSCGQSSKQPFCDGSHKGTEFVQLALEISEPQEVALCQCKRTKTPPFCDGSHTGL